MTPANVPFLEENMFGAQATVSIPGLQKILSDGDGTFETTATSITFEVSLNSPQSVTGFVLLTTASIESLTFTYEYSPEQPIDMVSLQLDSLEKNILCL